MSEVTKPIALDESLNTTESTPRNIADVVADETGDLVTQATAIVTKLQALINAVKPNASDIHLDPITDMSATNVQSGISELKGTLVDESTSVLISNNCYLNLKRFGKVVCATCTTGTTNTAYAINDVIASLPNGYKPFESLTVYIPNVNNTRLTVLTNGNIVTNNAMSSGVAPRFTASWITS